MSDAAFRKGFRKLQKHGLMFDLQTPWWHLHEAIDMASIAPDIPIILNHAGLPSDRSDSAMAGWRNAITQFAALPQAYVKISGLGLPGKPWSIDDNISIIRFCIDTFGPDRSMFASNYPVDSLCGSFDTIYNGFVKATQDAPATEKDAVFWKTASRVYKLRV